MGLPAEAYLQEAFAVKVYDGDTIEVILPDGSKKKVRYLGIDTPELHHPQRGEEELGKIAAAFNAQLVMKKAIILEVDVQPYDRYGRLLAWVWLSPKNKDLLVNEIITRNGLAMPFTLSPNVKYTDRIIRAFRLAFKERKGFWDKACRRVFTSEQAWNELPSLAGKFITLKLTIREIERSSNKVSLVDMNGKMRVVIYNDDLPRFSKTKFEKNLTLYVAGKLRTSFQGGQMKLADPIQIIKMKH
ncbi:nuclease (SNase domain-containing protein) [Thermovirga lienii DSM 17291]|uniref:Nuclease (SNase domain-containing protein) n=1 Tax=Thermovirga lienii (strain ATCC BAA-1197 / DSM 17291 / Cas60314) TaxID=580340 RepID=G7V9C8_THELD|nr:thermonuclease family protein [Thermovirga lienii]AER67588.1 nuclease (SNase domain-containing protein) [Thermovirga lienii DSM 17291]